MIGLYIHIPFCVRKCNYCDFLSAPADEDTQERYFRALLREIGRKGKKQAVSSVFFGGGTPSLWDGNRIGAILDQVRAHFALDTQAEITLECNPGTLTGKKAEEYRACGVNRLSIGLQSGNDRLLRKLGRIHTYAQFLESYQAAREAGFANLNVDLMSALPDQSMEDYEDTLRKVLALEPEHISAYSLIVEEGTPFYEQELALPDEDTERAMYERTRQLLQERGYVRYEISNYAKAGFACRHNLLYWDTTDYLGFGIGAASLYRGVRYRNRTDLGTYCRILLDHGEEDLAEETQVLTRKDRMEEFCFLGLRRMSGISAGEFERRFHVPFEKVYGDVVRKHEKLGTLVWLDGDRLALTDRGIDVSNVVLADFLLDA